MVKILPAVQEIQVRSLGREDPLEEDMATHSNILAWRIPWTEEPGSCSPRGCKKLDMAKVTEHAHMHREKKKSQFSFYLDYILYTELHIIHVYYRYTN